MAKCFGGWGGGGVEQLPLGEGGALDLGSQEIGYWTTVSRAEICRELGRGRSF